MKSKILALCLVVFLSVLFSVNVRAQGSKVDPIVISVIADLGHGSGADGLESLKLAVDEINAKKGVLVGGVRRPITIVPVDTRDMSPGVPVNDTILTYEKVILEKKPVANLMGAARSEAAMATLDILSQYKTIEISCSTMSPAIGQKIVQNYDKYKYRFQTNWNAMHLGKYIAQQFEYLGKKYGFKKAFLMNEDAMWARASNEAVQKLIEPMGWEIVGTEATPLGVTDFSGALMKVKRTGAQVISAVYSNPESSVMAKQMYDLRIPALQAGYNSFLAPGNTWEVLGGKCEGNVVALGGLGLIGSKKYPKSSEFEAKLRKRLGRWFDAIHTIGAVYDAVYVLVDAIERANSLDPDKLVSALEATSYAGVNGRVKFGKDHGAVYGNNPMQECVAVSFQWKKPGTRVPVLPQEIAEGEIDLPPWVKGN